MRGRLITTADEDAENEEISQVRRELLITHRARQRPVGGPGFYWLGLGFLV